MSWDTIKSELRGPITLIMPPFTAELELDPEALRRNIRYLVEGGLRTGRGAVIAPCGTGEYVALSPDEHRQMVEVAVEAANGAFPVVAGVGTCDLRLAIKLARAARDAGATCVMLSPPFYYRLDQNTYVEWIRAVAEAADIAIMAYSQFWRTGLGADISLRQLDELATIPSLVSIKYGSPHEFNDMITALARYSTRFAFIDNSLGYTSAVSHMHGAAGFITGPAAWWPSYELTFWDLLEAGRYQEADLHHARLAPYMRLFMGEESFGPDQPYLFGSALIKASHEYVGLYGGPVRPPFHELSGQQKSDLFHMLDGLGAPRGAALAAAR